MPNPFSFGPRITNPDYFVGREKELRKIFGFLDTEYTEQIQHVSVVGERRIGKSSLLYHLTQVNQHYLNYHAEYRFIYLDLQDPRTHTVSGLLRHILEEIELAPPKELTLGTFYALIEQQREEAGLWLILLLDEFEELTKRSQEFTDRFYDTLRSLGNNNLLGLVTASQQSLESLAAQEKLTSPFFNIFNQLELLEFTDAEVKALLELGRLSDRPFSDTDCRRIIKIAGNHPGRLQIVASLVYDAKDAATYLDWKDWKAIKKEAQAQPAFDANSNQEHGRVEWLRSALRWLIVSLPAIVGRAFLEFIGREEIATTTAWLWGLIWLLAAAALLLGLVDWSTITHYVRALFGLIFN